MNTLKRKDVHNLNKLSKAFSPSDTCVECREVYFKGDLVVQKNIGRVGLSECRNILGKCSLC